jgi:hypothetical protein
MEKSCREDYLDKNEKVVANIRKIDKNVIITKIRNNFTRKFITKLLHVTFSALLQLQLKIQRIVKKKEK